MPARLEIVREFKPELERSLISGALLNDEPLSLAELAAKLNEPTACRIQAPIDSSGSQTSEYHEGAYTFFPEDGSIVAESAQVKRADTRLALGTLIHSGSSIESSSVGALTEINTGCTLIRAHLGRGCFIGAGVTLEGASLAHFTVVAEGTIICQPTPEHDDLDLSHLRSPDIRW